MTNKDNKIAYMHFDRFEDAVSALYQSESAEENVLVTKRIRASREMLDTLSLQDICILIFISGGYGYNFKGKKEAISEAEKKIPELLEEYESEQNVTVAKWAYDPLINGYREEMCHYLMPEYEQFVNTEYDKYILPNIDSIERLFGVSNSFHILNEYMKFMQKPWENARVNSEEYSHLCIEIVNNNRIMLGEDLANIALGYLEGKAIHDNIDIFNSITNLFDSITSRDKKLIKEGAISPELSLLYDYIFLQFDEVIGSQPEGYSEYADIFRVLKNTIDNARNYNRYTFDPKTYINQRSLYSNISLLPSFYEIFYYDDRDFEYGFIDNIDRNIFVPILKKLSDLHQNGSLDYLPVDRSKITESEMGEFANEYLSHVECLFNVFNVYSHDGVEEKVPYWFGSTCDYLYEKNHLRILDALISVWMYIWIYAKKMWIPEIGSIMGHINRLSANKDAITYTLLSRIVFEYSADSSKTYIKPLYTRSLAPPDAPLTKWQHIANADKDEIEDYLQEVLTTSLWKHLTDVEKSDLIAAHSCFEEMRENSISNQKVSARSFFSHIGCVLEAEFKMALSHVLFGLNEYFGENPAGKGDDLYDLQNMVKNNQSLGNLIHLITNRKNKGKLKHFPEYRNKLEESALYCNVMSSPVCREYINLISEYRNTSSHSSDQQLGMMEAVNVKQILYKEGLLSKIIKSRVKDIQTSHDSSLKS